MFNKKAYLAILKRREAALWTLYECGDCTYDEYVQSCFIPVYLAELKGISDEELLQIFPEDVVYRW